MGRSRHAGIIVAAVIGSLCFPPGLGAGELEEIMADYDFFAHYEIIRDLPSVENYGVEDGTSTVAAEEPPIRGMK